MVVFECDAASGWSGSIPCDSHASWELTFTQIYSSIIVYLVVAAITKVVGIYWHNLPEIPGWAQTWFGSPGNPPDKRELNAAFRLAQLCASTIVVMLWIFKSYELEVSDGVYAVEIICCLVFIAHLASALIANGFSMDYALGFEAFLDAFTITPLIMQGAGGSWLTFAYLRVYRMNTAFNRLAGTGILDDHLGELSIALIQKLVAMIMVIAIIGGTFFVFEGLGDVEHFADRFVNSNMGDISFFQMCYFAFMVMSTVGFGDFSPTTVFSRFFIFFATVGGVLFFSLASSEILDLSAKLKSGLGKYRPKKKKGVNGYRGHILVMGGGVSAPTRDACEVFLKSLIRDETTPEVVLMGDYFSEDVKDMLSEHWASGIQWFTGSCLNESDLNRVLVADTSMVFYIADFNTSDTFSEDYNNILAATALQKLYPVLQYRLMAIEVQHLELAAHVGLNMFNVYAIDGLKAAILATTLKCPGFPTLVLNLGLPDIAPPRPTDEPISPWLDEYIKSAGLEPYGFMPAPRFFGMTFRQVAIDMGKLDIVVFAVQVEGSLRLNPGNNAVIDEKSVLFAMSPDQSVLDAVSINNSAAVHNWLPQFGANRRENGVALAKRMEQVLKLDQSSNFVSSANESSDGSVRESVSGGLNNAGSVNTKGMKGVLAIGHKRRMKLPTLVHAVSGRNKSTSVYQPMEDDFEELEQDSEFQPPISLREEGGHVVLALLFQEESHANALFAQVEVIVNNLRSTSDAPVVIIGQSLPAQIKSQLIRIRDKYKVEGEGPNVFYVEGDPLNPKVLNKAYLRSSAQFLSLTPSVAPVHADIPDRNNVMAQNIIDAKLRKWKRFDLAPVFDWCSPNSFPLMPDAPTSYSKLATDPLPNFLPGDKAFADKEPRCHYRYASGRVLPKPLIAGVYSMAYYTPGVLELFEALIDPSKTDQEARPWPVPIDSEFFGKPYSKLAMYMLEIGAVPLGLLRSAGPLPYVLSLTTQDPLVLADGDAVYVLASMDWAEENSPFSQNSRNSIVG